MSNEWNWKTEKTEALEAVACKVPQRHFTVVFLFVCLFSQKCLWELYLSQPKTENSSGICPQKKD